MSGYALKSLMPCQWTDCIRQKYGRIIGEQTIEQGLNDPKKSGTCHQTWGTFGYQFFDYMHVPLLTNSSDESKGGL